MRRDMFFPVIIFALCTFLIGVLLRQTLILIFCDWGLEPFHSLVFVLNMFVLLPFFGLLTYMRYALLDNYSLPSIGYFVWASPILFASVWAYSTTSAIPITYVSLVFGGLLGTAIAITYRSIDKQQRALETDERGI